VFLQEAKQMSYVRGLVCLAMVAAAMSSARAADIPVSGYTARLRDFDGVARRSSRVRLVDADIDLSGVDPTVTGATVEFFSTTTAQLLTLTLPAEGWEASSAPVRRFRFRSRANPRLRVSLDNGSLAKFQMRGAQAYPLGQLQVAVVVRLTVGTTRFCAEFGGTVARDDGKRFVAFKAPPPVSCPLAPGEGSTTTTTEPSSTTTSSTTTTEIETTTTSSSTTTEIETTTTSSTTTTTEIETTTSSSTTTTTDTTTTTLATCGDGVVSGSETCDDGNTTPCDGCSATCQLETPCNDGVPCTIDSCDPATGACRFDPNDAFCDDGDDTTTDRCDPSCDPSLQSCDPTTGCVHTGGGCGCS
jgi:cysteine-rich repeat protein